MENEKSGAPILRLDSQNQAERKVALVGFIIVMIGVIFQYVALGELPLMLWILAVAMSIVAVPYFWKNRFTGPILVLDEEGVFDARLGVGTIRWLDIKRAYQYRFSVYGAPTDFICFELYNEQTYRARKTFLSRLNLNLLIGGPFSIVVSGLKIEPKRLFEIIVTEVEKRRAASEQQQQTEVGN